MASGLEFGYAYASSLIDTAEGRCPDGDVAFYRPTTHPGSRLPHTVIRDADDEAVSTHDVIAPTGLTLFTADPHNWVAQLAGLPTAVPLRVVALTAAAENGHAAMISLFEVGERGAVVVRPDGHVVWRTREDATSVDQLRDFAKRAVRAGDECDHPRGPAAEVRRWSSRPCCREVSERVIMSWRPAQLGAGLG